MSGRFRNCRMLGCNIYLSEGRSKEIINSVKGSFTASGNVALVNCFQDSHYNRTGFTLVATAPQPLASAVVKLSKAALSRLDLRQHTATHPRLGVVDHIVCNPLGPIAELSSAAKAAQRIGRGLGIGEHAVPVFLYGASHPDSQTLASIRRASGYFKGSGTGLYTGASLIRLPEGLQPDFGPTSLDPRHGFAAVGAVPWVVNYNVLVHTEDMQACRSIAKAISTKGGGLPSVEAMALRHDKGIEVACNLLDTNVTAPEAVLEAIGRHAAGHGIDVGAGYTTNQTPKELCRLASEQMALASGCNNDQLPMRPEHG